MAFSWRDLDFDSTTVETLRHDLTVGNTGLQPSEFPCVTHLESIDLSLHFNGPMPGGDDGNIVMGVYFNGRVYLGPPIRHITIKNFPVCRESLGPMNVEEDALWGYLSIGFTNLDKRKATGYGGEQAFPILFWKDVEVDLLPIPRELSPSGSFTQIIVRPVDPNAPYPNFLTRP